MKKSPTTSFPSFKSTSLSNMTASNNNSALLNLPSEVVAMMFSGENCDYSTRMSLRGTCRALRVAVPPPTLAELADLEARWDVAERLDLYASCRCRAGRCRTAFSFLMMNYATWSSDDCTDALTRELCGHPRTTQLVLEGEAEKQPDSKPKPVIKYPLFHDSYGREARAT